MRLVLRLVASFLLVAAPLMGIVNPALQPIHLMERYKTVLGAEFLTVDQKTRRATLRVIEVVNGQFAPKQVTLDASAAEAAEGFANVHQGGLIVAYVGKANPRHKLEFMLYAGDGRWGSGVMDDADASTWRWTGDPDKSATAEEGKGNAAMWGTFAGREDRLLGLMRDQSHGTAFFNAVPMISFDNDVIVGKCDGPVRGVALYDLDGDGRPDVIATSEKGVKIWLQKAPLAFTDSTAALTLSVPAVSVNVADATGSGRPDLLLDGVIWRRSAGADGFTPSRLLPDRANRQVVSSAFMDVDGDGYPDVLISKRGGGLELYRNPGQKGGPFIDVTKDSGLDRAECGSGSTGYFAPAPYDWDGGIRPGIWYSAGQGFLLRQDTHGVFNPVAHDLRFDKDAKPFTVDGRCPGLSGGAVWAAMWTPQQPTLFVPLDNDFRIAFWEKGALVDATSWANELSERTYYQSFSIAEDLDMDGTIDTWTASRSPSTQNTCHINRGYGSWMRAEKYKHLDQTEVFNSEAHLKGAGGAAAGDVDGDGFNDVLIGNLDGTVSLLMSDLSTQRHQPQEHPTYHLKKLAETGIVSVQVSGRTGVTGAVVTISAKGRTLGRRDLGANVATGCRGPDVVNLAVRADGPCTVTVRFSDGATASAPVEAKPLQRAVVVLDRKQAR